MWPTNSFFLSLDVALTPDRLLTGDTFIIHTLRTNGSSLGTFQMETISVGNRGTADTTVLSLFTFM
jgi:hypothetical protein